MSVGLIFLFLQPYVWSSPEILAGAASAVSRFWGAPQERAVGSAHRTHAGAEVPAGWRPHILCYGAGGGLCGVKCIERNIKEVEENYRCVVFLSFKDWGWNKRLFGFSFKLNLSTRPEKFLGDIEVWNQAEKVSGVFQRARILFEWSWLPPQCKKAEPL